MLKRLFGSRTKRLQERGARKREVLFCSCWEKGRGEFRILRVAIKITSSEDSGNKGEAEELVAEHLGRLLEENKETTGGKREEVAQLLDQKEGKEQEEREQKEEDGKGQKEDGTMEEEEAQQGAATEEEG